LITAFIASLIFVVLAEMGDKTQLLAMAFACKFCWQTAMRGERHNALCVKTEKSLHQVRSNNKIKYYRQG